MKLGLLGKNIAHSKSKEIYERLLGSSVSYSLFDYSDAHSIPCLEQFFSDGLIGLSITAPYKNHFVESVIIEEAVVRKLGAINCIKKTPDGFKATNTDLSACKELLEGYKGSGIERFIVLGSGAMARVTKTCLENLGVIYEEYFRSKDGDISSLNLSSGTSRPTLVINTCAREYVFGGKLPSETIFWDHNYSHAAHSDSFPRTFPHARYTDGMGLLELQAAFALKFWKIIP